MGAIHELREEYRYYRAENPGYRWLFLLLDLVVLLIKLAAFGGFLFLCWYLVSRSPNAEQAGLLGSKAPAADEAVREQVPAISDERLARLREIAGQEVSPEDAKEPALVGNVTAAPESVTTNQPVTGNTTAISIGINQSLSNSAVVVASSEAQPAPVALDTAVVVAPSTLPEVQVESVAVGEPGIVRSEDTFTDNIYIPSDTENGTWVLNQSSGDHTIQLALTVNVEFLENFARKLPPELTAAIYPERINGSGNIQYSLSLGSFPSKRSAEIALAELDENLKRYGAHTRTFDELHSNLANFVR